MASLNMKNLFRKYNKISKSFKTSVLKSNLLLSKQGTAINNVDYTFEILSLLNKSF